MKNKKSKVVLPNNSYKKAFKFRFYPDYLQIELLNHYFGSSRFVFNHTLSYSINNYNSKTYNITDDYGNLLTLSNNNYKNINNLSRVNYLHELKIVHPWLSNVSSIVLQQSIINLNSAYDKFFTKKAKFPRFKKKSNRNSFKIVGKNSLHFDQNGDFTLPKFKTPLHIIFTRNFNRSKVSSVSVSKEPNGHYYISFLSEAEYKTLPSKYNKLGFDTGISNTFTGYNESKDKDKDNKKVINKSFKAKGISKVQIPNLNSILSKIKSLHKEVSHKTKGSNNRNKARIKLAKAYGTKVNIVNDFYHKLSFQIVRDNQVIIGEDLDLAQMKLKSLCKNKNLNRNIRRNLQNISLSKLYAYIEYKCRWYGKTFIRANKYYPSSKLCSQPRCNHINYNLQLSDRTWKCPECGTKHDRDENAAVNLYNYTEDNAKLIIEEVLKYHRKNKPVLVKNKVPCKINSEFNI